MLIISTATVAGVQYWQRSALHSMWLGHGTDLLGTGPGLEGSPVDARALRDLLAAKSPGGGPLTARPGQRRRQGWDLVFGAPKSVSLMAAAEDGAGATTVRAAFRQAVADTFSVLEQKGAWVYRQSRRERATGLVAGAFEHMSGGAGQAHLHAHVVLANLAAREDGQWGCLVGSELWRWREGLGACFQLALRAELTRGGLSLDWEVGRGGLGEVAGTGRLARPGASSRSLATRAGSLWFGSASRGAGRVAQGQTRSREPERPGASAPGATRATGGERAASQSISQSTSQPVVALSGAGLPPPPPSPAAVSSALAERRSSFAEPDVLVALAEACPSGLDARQAARWARAWCEAALPGAEHEGVASTSVPGRWTTSLAAHFDRQVTATELEGRFAHLAEVDPTLASQELDALGYCGAAAPAASELACSGRAVEALPRAPWLAQAACLDAARAVWQAAGMTVLVTAPSDASEKRWRALTSLHRVDQGRWGRPGRRVLVVDAADRIGPAGLARLLSQAASSGTKLVLVPGGTVPGYGESMAASLDDLLARSALPSLGGSWPSTLPGRAFATVSVPGLAVHGAFTGGDALRHTVSAWLQRHLSGEPALMVALGPPEAEGLNVATRKALGLPGTKGEVPLGGRPYAPGERVMALRRIGSTGGPRTGVPAGTRGTVLSTGPGWLSVEWETPTSAQPMTVGGERARDLGYGYATTVPYVRRASRGDALIVLGDPFALGAPGALAVLGGACVTVAGPGMPAPSPGNDRGLRWRAAISELAVGWPDEEMLLRCGPRPIERTERERWESSVAAGALERAYGQAVNGRAAARRTDRWRAGPLRIGPLPTGRGTERDGGARALPRL